MGLFSSHVIIMCVYWLVVCFVSRAYVALKTALSRYISVCIALSIKKIIIYKNDEALYVDIKKTIFRNAAETTTATNFFFLSQHLR